MPLISANEFASQYDVENKIALESTKTLEIPGPRFAVNKPPGLRVEEIVKLSSPPIEVIDIPDATVIGGTNLIISGGKAIHPDLFDPARDVIPAETFGVASIDLKQKNIEIRSSVITPKVEGKAISLLGQCTGNYAHWLTETLPKLLIIDEIAQFEGIPLLVDSWIHPVFRKSIDLFNKGNRPVIGVNRWQTLRLDSVVDISPPAYVPPEFRGYEGDACLPPPDSSFFPYSQTALEKLRNAGQGMNYRSNDELPRNLYLSRAPKSVGNPRFLTNQVKIEQFMRRRHFEIIDPAELSFSEQIAVFSQAECIVAPVGASLANSIFSPPGCKVIGLAPYYHNANYYYFSNLMGTLGHELLYVLGTQVETTGEISNRNYSIEIEFLEGALDTIGY